MKKFLVLFCILLAVGAFFYFENQEGKSESAERSASEGPRVKVLVKHVEFTENSRIFEGVGTGRARLSADIYPAISEEVMEVLFEAQQKVTKGDILVHLDDREEKLALELAEVELKDAESLLQRYQKAGKEGAVPESEVDSAQATFDSAKVAVEQAKLQLEERQITAPFDGYVGIPNVDPGDRVDTGTMITGLDARDILYVDFEVPEALASELRVAQDTQQEVTVTTPSFPSKTFYGRITAQESRVNPERRTLTARASIDNSEDFLRPGMSFTVKWNIAGEEYATVPEISVQWSREGSFIWLVRNDQAVKTMARVVARKSGMVLLEGEMKDDEPVVVEGLQRLRPDVKVEVLNQGEGA